MDYTRLTLPQVYAEAEAIAVDAQTLFGRLDARQLNWKPAPDSWSVAQCLDHLIAINRGYYPTFDRVLNGQHQKTLLQRVPVLPAVWGWFMITTLSPKGVQKFKAPKTARPSASVIDGSIVQRFIMQQHETLARMRSLENKNPYATVITSPYANFVVYSLFDAFRLIVAHERRHFAQAQRVMALDGFPRQSARPV